MKKLIPTLVLVLVCVGLFGYASSNNFFKEEEKLPQPLLAVKEENVQSFAVTIVGSEASQQSQDEPQTTEIVREGDGWTMKKPADYPLNANAIDSWFSYIGAVTQDMVVEEQATDLAKYGLEKPGTEIRIIEKNGMVRTLRIGDSLAIAGYKYAAIDDVRTVYRVGESAVNAIGKTPLDFIDKNPVRFDADTIQSLKVEWKGASWTLEKAEQEKSAYESKWKLGDKELEGGAATSIVSKARLLATEAIPKLAVEAGLVGGSASDLKLTVVTKREDGGEATQTYSGKLDGETVWVADALGTWAYAIPVATVDELYNQNQN